MNVLFLPDGAPDWPRLVPALIIFACAGALSTAYTAEYAFDLEPCILCLYQRIPYALAGVFALAAIMMPRGGLRQMLVVVCVPVFLVSTGLAFYHVGVEQHWWMSATGCGGAIPDAMSVADLSSGLLDKPQKSCDRLDWTLFGLSMATYNAVASFILTVATIAGLRRMGSR